MKKYLISYKIFDLIDLLFNFFLFTHFPEYFRWDMRDKFQEDMNEWGKLIDKDEQAKEQENEAKKKLKGT